MKVAVVLLCKHNSRHHFQCWRVALLRQQIRNHFGSPSNHVYFSPSFFFPSNHRIPWSLSPSPLLPFHFPLSLYNIVFSMIHCYSTGSSQNTPTPYLCPTSLSLLSVFPPFLSLIPFSILTIITFLNFLPPPPPPQAVRVGRGPGSGKGKTCGRGHKGQGQRNKAAIRVGFEGGQTPFYLRVPKRGFRNKFVNSDSEMLLYNSTVEPRYNEHG